MVSSEASYVLFSRFLSPPFPLRNFPFAQPDHSIRCDHLQVSYRTLPRQQFGNLQSKLFPHYFRLQSIGSLALLGLYHRAGKLVKSDRNMWVLSVMAVTSSLNWIIVGPWATGKPPRFPTKLSKLDSPQRLKELTFLYESLAVMKKRHRRERIEGKDYNAADVSLSLNSLLKCCRSVLFARLPLPPSVSTSCFKDAVLTLLLPRARTGFARDEVAQLEIRCSTLGLFAPQPRIPRSRHSHDRYLGSLRCRIVNASAVNERPRARFPAIRKKNI